MVTQTEALGRTNGALSSEPLGGFVFLHGLAMYSGRSQDTSVLAAFFIGLSGADTMNL